MSVLAYHGFAVTHFVFLRTVSSSEPRIDKWRHGLGSILGDEKDNQKKEIPGRYVVSYSIPGKLQLHMIIHEKLYFS
jgi:hypothetical protein